MPIKYGANGLHDGTDETKQLAFDVTGVTTGTTRTVTVPDKSGTLAMTSDIPAGGKVLQVVHADMARDGGTASTTSTTYIDVGLSANITPSAIGNKILVLVTYNPRNKAPPGQDGLMTVKLLRDTTDVQELVLQDDNAGKLGDVVFLSQEITWNESFTATSTAQLTFKLQVKMGASNTGYYKYNGGNITLMEVAA